MAESVKSLWKEDDGKLTRYEIHKLNNRLKEEFLEYKVNKENKKNDKMYLYLLLAEDFNNIQYLQKFEVNYLKSNSSDIRESLTMVEQGIKVKSIERQTNVSLDFLRKVNDEVLDKLDEYNYELNTEKIKPNHRFVDTKEVYEDYLDNMIDIIGYIRDGMRVLEVLDEVGTLYNTREWMRFTDYLTDIGYDMGSNSLLDEIILTLLDNLDEDEIISELGLSRSVQKEVNYLTNNRGFTLDVDSIIGKHTLDVKEPINTEDYEKLNKLYKEGTLLDYISESKGEELLKSLYYVIIEYGTITELYESK